MRHQEGSFLVVDDHALVREGVVSVLRSLAPAMQVLQAGTHQEAVDAVGAGGHLSLTIILDLQLPDCEGLATLQGMRTAAPRARIAIVSANNDLELALACIQEGACAFVPKQGSLIEFQQALSVVASGGVYFPRDLFVSAGLPAASSAPATPANLTPRQHEVLSLLLDGLSNAAIAEQLAISEETAKLHVRAILRAHDAANRVQLLLGFARHAA